MTMKTKLLLIIMAATLVAACAPVPDRTPEPIQCMVLVDADVYPSMTPGENPSGQVKEGQLLTILEVIEDNPTGTAVVLSTAIGWVKTPAGFIRTGVCQ